MKDPHIRLILDTSAVLAYAAGSIDLGETIADPPGTLSRVLPVAAAVATFEVARRWRQRRLAPPALRSWKTRSSVLRGFF